MRTKHPRNRAPLGRPGRYFLQLTLGLCAVLAMPVSWAANCSITTDPSPAAITAGESVTFTGSVSGKPPTAITGWTFEGGNLANANGEQQVTVTYASAVGSPFTTTMTGIDGKDGTCSATVDVTVTGNGGGGNTPPTANDDSYSATTGVLLSVTAPGVLGNDTDDGQVQALRATNLNTALTGGSVNLASDGSFTYTSPGGFVGADSFAYDAFDGEHYSTATVTINVADVPPPPEFPTQTDFKIMMNYELGMHCTGFEFAYCCVLPAYNSILAQVVKPNTIDPNHNGDYARLLEGDPKEGLDALGRETVVRDLELDGNGNFKKYVLRYWHDAQPRNDGRGKAQTSTLISAVEGNSLMAWNTTFNSAAVKADGTFVTGPYNGADGVMLGDNDLTDPTDNYQNAIWNHLYFYENLEGDNSSGTSLDNDKIRLGVSGQSNPQGIPSDIAYPADCGPAFHPMGPVTQGGDPKNNDAVDNNCGGFSNGNVLTFSGDKGTVVYTQMKVLENLPIMLTSPDIWEALGLPLTPFEDSIDFFSDPGLLDEDSVRPFVAMKAQMHEYDSTAYGGIGAAVMDGNNEPVIGFGTAPIDIPNCERCHSNGPDGSFVTIPPSESSGVADDDPDKDGIQMTVANSPNNDPDQYLLVTQEYEFWKSIYPSMETGSDWYARLKSAAISMLNGHDTEHGTSFTANYPGGNVTGELPQNTRLGHESVICQRCHADNVIAVVKSASCGPGSKNPNDPSSCNEGDVIKPITEAIHNNHRGLNSGGTIAFADSNGRDGSCQGCHPAHRSNGDMQGYPITLAGTNRYAAGDNRGASGGCFVGRDVHSNPGKDSDGAGTPEHLNAVGQWLASNVFSNQHVGGGDKGIWCTNCHNQLGQEMWKAENMEDLVHGIGQNNVRAGSLQDIADQVAGGNLDQVTDWLDPKGPGNTTYDIWNPDPGLCDYVDNQLGTVLAGGIPSNPAHDGNVATIEVHVGGSCSEGYVDGPNLTTAFGCNTPATLCGTFDGDGDFSVHILDFCTTLDCVNAAQEGLTNSLAVPVPFSAATDGRDHWLSAGEPHCADCHAAPYVEQSGNINAYPPFNYPRKASLMRYSKGHQGITCQGCHESIHGLYPVTPNIDTTSYAQAASLNHDGSHGPLKCGTCHLVNGAGVPSHIEDGLEYNGVPIKENYDAAVSWMHTFTAEADPRTDYCLTCHADNSSQISLTNRTWAEHSYKGRSSREMMDKAESLQLTNVAGNPAEGYVDPTNTVCTSCHGDRSNTLARRGCTTKWKNHLVEGRASEAAWEYMSEIADPKNCGW